MKTHILNSKHVYKILPFINNSIKINLLNVCGNNESKNKKMRKKGKYIKTKNQLSLRKYFTRGDIILI